MTSNGIEHGAVKQVSSGDTVIIRGVPKGGPPQLKTLTLSNIIAPKLAKRPSPNSNEESKEEPFAWEAREFLRKKLIGKVLGTDLIYTTEKPGNKEYHTLILAKDENLNESLIKEGLVTLRPSAPQNYKELDEQAKTAGKGRYSKTPPVVRDVKWTLSTDAMQSLIDQFQKKPIKTIIENVRDGSTVRCFVTPDEKTFYNVTLLMAGIKCPSSFRPDSDNRPDSNDRTPFAEEAKYFVESRLLQREVEITLDAISGPNFVGSIIHPKGNIAELLLSEGYAKCFDWTIQYAKSAEKLRAAERQAKEKKRKLWKDWQPTAPQITGADKEFAATVVEIVNGDALMVKLANGAVKKIFLASIRPPRLQGESENKEGAPPVKRLVRPLYEIPWMFEAREFLRKKLIGKKVNVIVEYIQPPRDGYPEKTCCTVSIGSINVAEALVLKGLATVIKNRQDDDQRSVHWDKLNIAQNKAMKSLKGVHAKKDIPVHRINDHSSDSAKAKAIFPHLKRGRTEALVEFVASGSRLRLYIPKESCLITLLLAGITCPRAPRQTPGGNVPSEGDPYGYEALQFTKEKCLQREVEFSLETHDKAGNFIGWLWIENENLSVALVQEGLSTVHFSSERSEHYRALVNAEKSAKEEKLNIWKDRKEEDESIKHQEEETLTERTINQQKVVVIEVTNDLHIYTQLEEQGQKLHAMLEKMRQELVNVVVGAYTPKKGDLCAAIYMEDNQWYRARVEKVTGNKVKVFYIDYGNRDEIESNKCAALPHGYNVDKPYASEYALAFVKPISDNDYRLLAEQALREDLVNNTVLLNVEYKFNNFQHVTLVNPVNKTDCVLQLVEHGYILVDRRRDQRLQTVVQEYIKAEEEARKSHKIIWEFGDITEDDDKEFGLGR